MGHTEEENSTTLEEQRKIEMLLSILVEKKENLYLRQESIQEKLNCLANARNRIKENVGLENEDAKMFLDEIEKTEFELKDGMRKCDVAHDGILSLTADLNITDKTKNYCDALSASSFDEFKSAKSQIQRKEITQSEAALSIVSLCDEIIKDVDKILQKADALLQKINAWQSEIEEANKEEIYESIKEDIEEDSEAIEKDNEEVLHSMDNDLFEEDEDEDFKTENSVNVVENLKEKISMESIQKNLENGSKIKN